LFGEIAHGLVRGLFHRKSEDSFVLTGTNNIVSQKIRKERFQYRQAVISRSNAVAAAFLDAVQEIRDVVDGQILDFDVLCSLFLFSGEKKEKQFENISIRRNCISAETSFMLQIVLKKRLDILKQIVLSHLSFPPQEPVLQFLRGQTQQIKIGMQVVLRPSELFMAQVSGQDWQRDLCGYTLFIEPFETASSESVPQIMKSWSPVVFPWQVGLFRQCTETRRDSAPIHLLALEIDEKRHVRADIKTKFRFLIHILFQCHCRRLTDRNYPAFMELGSLDKDGAICKIYVFMLHLRNFDTPKPGAPDESDNSPVRLWQNRMLPANLFCSSHQTMNVGFVKLITSRLVRPFWKHRFVRNITRNISGIQKQAKLSQTRDYGGKAS
jgi:hypothetical protein